ncbi:hypothetical protein Tco_0664412 [Tanacetum coccineum]
MIWYLNNLLHHYLYDESFIPSVFISASLQSINRADGTDTSNTGCDMHSSLITGSMNAGIDILEPIFSNQPLHQCIFQRRVHYQTLHPEATIFLGVRDSLRSLLDIGKTKGDAYGKCILKVETVMIWTPENRAHFESEKSDSLILTGIGDEIYSTVDACQTDQEMWEAIERYNKAHAIQDTKAKRSQTNHTTILSQLDEEDSDPETSLEVPNADSGTDAEPLEQIQYDTNDNVFGNDIQHLDQSESISNPCAVETGDSNVTPDSPDMCDNDI